MRRRSSGVQDPERCERKEYAGQAVLGKLGGCSHEASRQARRSRRVNIVSSAGNVAPTGKAGLESEQGVAVLEVPQIAEAVRPSDFEEIWQTQSDNAPALAVENWSPCSTIWTLSELLTSW